MSILMDKLNTLDVEQKFARIIIDLRNIRPFYSAIYECIEKKCDENINTMAVSIDALHYNYEFVNKISYGEFLFIVLHEIAHISLRHVSRMGNSDPQLWNIACDFYVNGMLAEEFGFDLSDNHNQFSVGISENAKINQQSVSLGNNLEILLPSYILRLPTLDLNLDSVESLYQAMLEQKMEQDQDDDNDDNQGDNNDDNQGDSNDDNQGDNNPRSYTFKIKGSNQNSKTNKATTITVKENQFESDLIKPTNGTEEADYKAEELIINARTKLELSNPGTDHCTLQKIVEKSLKGKVNWKNILRKYLRAATMSDTSYSNPDKRFMHSGDLILPGQIEDDLTKIEGVKICIDVSGSINNGDLQEFLGQVWQICKTFKVSAEIIYWDTVICSQGTFTGYKEFKRVDIYGGGGTDPACVFDYFNSKECKDKPIVTLMFTDGYINKSFDTPLNKRLYGKNTIWIMSKYGDPNFEPAFGKVVYPTWKSKR